MRHDGQIEQTLHGYDGGHRLLASSINLSSNEKKYLLELSDLSGSRASGFDEYLTGYMIPGSRKYAFSKTWYAYEMERPGCVWTHTLLIEPNDFHKTFNLQVFLNFFKRPQKGKYQDFSESVFYSNSLQQIHQYDLLSTQEDDYFLYANIFHNLYERINKVVIVSNNSLKYEKFVIRFWSQMWSALRSRFSFCTGSISCRALKGEPFILQVVPSQNVGAFRSEFSYSNNLKKKPNKLVFIEEDYLPSKSLNWERYENIYISFQNLLFNYEGVSTNNLLSFVWHYGEKLQPFRKNFGWLVKFYELIKEPKKNFNELDEITKALVGKFSNENNLRELKLLLFGNQNIFIENNIHLDNPFHIKPIADENLILDYLLKTSYADFFEVDTLYLTKRFELLWEHSPKDAEDLLVHLWNLGKLNDIQFTFLDASAKAISQTLFRDLMKKNIDLAKFILKKNPWFAVKKDVWNHSIEVQDEIFEALISESVNKVNEPEIYQNWRKIVWAMLESQNDNYVNRIYESFGNELIEWVLDWHSANDDNELKGNWKTILSKSYEFLMEWLVNNENKIKTKALIAKIINPHTQIVRHYGSFPWLDLAKNNKGYTKAEILEINGFLLSLGLANTDINSKILVAESFSSIYKSAENNQLPHTIWLYLRTVVPNGGLFLGWDKCRRLEEAIIALILESGWDIEIILQIATSEHILFRLIRRADEYYKARKLLWKLGDRVKEETVKAKKWQKKILDSYCK